jgi:hypothetical protein
MAAYGPCKTQVSAGTGAAGVKAFGNYAYALDPYGGLAVINIANPAAMSNSCYLYSLALGSSPQEIVLNGKYALCSDSATGLRIVSLF